MTVSSHYTRRSTPLAELGGQNNDRLKRLFLTLGHTSRSSKLLVMVANLSASGKLHHSEVINDIFYRDSFRMVARVVYRAEMG